MKILAVWGLNVRYFKSGSPYLPDVKYSVSFSTFFFSVDMNNFVREIFLYNLIRILFFSSFFFHTIAVTSITRI